MASANPSFDALVSHTLKNYRKLLADNVTGHQALFDQLKKRGYIREEDGGTTIVEPLMTGLNTTVGSYQGYDVLDVTPQEGLSAAEYDWKQIFGTLTISGEEEFKNSGSKTRVLNLLSSKLKQLEISMRLEVNKQLFGDGTGNGSKDLTGLDIAVEDGTAWATYGGIDSNLHTFWRNQFLDFDGTHTSFSTVSGNSVEGLVAMRKIYNSASRGNMTPSLIITTQDIFELYEGNLDDKRRFTDSKLGEAGFANLLFKNVPIVFDEDCPSGSMFFLNSEAMRFVIGKGRNFVTTPFVRPSNQDAKSSQVILFANLTVNHRARLGRIIDIV